MELRNKKKDGYDDEVIFSARLPAELIEDSQKDSEDGELVDNIESANEEISTEEE